MSSQQISSQGLWNSDRVLLAIALIVLLGMFGQFFGTTLRSGFRFVGGDAGDGGLIAFLHEHVYRSLMGQASLRNPTFFFPTKGVLGYTDAFLLNQIFYTPLRILGFEPLLAVQLTFMALTVMGCTACAALLIRFLGVRVWLAILSAAIFAFGHALYMKTLHPQHLAIEYLPIVIYLALSAILVARSTAGTTIVAFCAAIIFGLTFVTGYYMAWFFAFFLLFALPCFLILYRTSVAEFARANRRRLLTALTAGAIGIALGAGVVLWIFGPALAALKTLSRQAYLTNAATFRDIVNVSDTNFLWGALLRDAHLIDPGRLQHTELSLAVTPLLVLVTLIGTILLLRRRQPSKYEKIAGTLCASILFGYVMVYLSTITFGGTSSLFLLLQKFVPGAIGIRVGFRSQVASALFVTIAFAVAAEAFLRRSEGLEPSWFGKRVCITPSFLVLAVAVVIAVEQVNLKPLALLDRIDEDARLSAVPPAPTACRVFAIYNDSARMLQAIQIDAMRISQRFGLPTVNGYSGGTPPGWQLSNVWEPTYPEMVLDWTRGQGVAGPVCLYDATVKMWREIG